MNFEALQLIEPIQKALSEQGYTEATAIQAGAIPPALEGRDVLGSARTGTGKTCAFAAPILQRLYLHPVQGRPIRALILTPTRELAIQNQEQMEAYGRHLPLKSVVIFGGVGQKPQVDAIQAGADILIATPGRLADLYGQGLLDLSRLEIFVLDEADRMLDMGFIHDVRKILKWLPKQKQTLFFSATMPEEIMDLVNQLLRDPARVAVDPVSSPVEVIAQSAWPVDRGNKTKLIVWLLEQQRISSALVFTRTKHGADKVSRDLNRAGVASAAIHGNKSQTARQNALASFKEGKIRVLVATDIAARGLDIQDLPCVINYNLPEVPETYIHRIGRTGRAGKGGVAFTLYDFSETPLLRQVEKLMKKTVPLHEEHPWPMEQFDAPARDKRGKIINAEDAEARRAAREKHNARKKEQSQKQQKQQAAPAAPRQEPLRRQPEPPVSAPEPSEEIPYYSLDLLPPRTEQQLSAGSDPFDSKDILHRKYRRPARRVVPSLSQVSLLPGEELKETFSSRLQVDRELMFPDLTDSTDRLLARKRSGGKGGKKRTVKAKKSGPESQNRGQSGKAKKAEPAKPEPNSQPEQAKAQKPKTSAGSKRRGKKKRGRVQAAKQGGAQAAPKTQQNAPEARPLQGAQGIKTASGSRKRRRSLSRRPPVPPVTTHQKDSTEQASLMKPYYLSDHLHRKG